MADKKTGSHVKIKSKDLECYKQWSNIAGLLFYIHNPMYKESYLIKIGDIENIILSGNCSEGCYLCKLEKEGMDLDTGLRY